LDFAATATKFPFVCTMDLTVLSSAADGTTALWEAARAGSHTLATYRDNTPLLRGACGGARAA
jgi:hypothetical protein